MAQNPNSTSSTISFETSGLAKKTKIRPPPLALKKKGGAPKGNQNGFKTGLHTAAYRAHRAEVRAFLQRVRLTLAAVEDAHGLARAKPSRPAPTGKSAPSG
jgi:hypothetical protein